MTATQQNPLTGNHWQLDAGHSTAEFHVRTYWGLITVHGRFQQLDGEIQPNGQMALRLQAASLDTGNHRRDNHLRSADFFDTDRHPQISFRSTSVEQIDDGLLRVAGELHAAGRRVQIELQPTIRHIGDHQLELSAETTVDQRQLGMTYRRLGIRTPVTIVVQARLGPAPESTAGNGLPRTALARPTASSAGR